jgi:hypothetical protein
MDHLFYVLSITLSCVACAQEREKCIPEVHAHEVRHGQITTAKTEVTLVRLGVVLDPVTCEVNDVSGLD